MDYIRQNQVALAEKLGGNLPLDGLVLQPLVQLDDDIKAAFNAVGDHQTTQQILLQLQSIRRLDELIKILGKQLVAMDPGNSDEEIDDEE